ncbi:MAG: ADP-ribosylglycohydrolase family protein [Pseudomonadota bacterium]
MTEDRLIGAFLGLAIGDALGATLEFAPRDTHPLVTEMVGGPWNMPPGGWTDDTSMALCLAESLLAHPEFDTRDLMNRFVNWWRWGYKSHTGACFDIGATTQTALQKYELSGEPLAGSTDPASAGNGSIMRLAPVALAFHRDPERAKHIAAAQSATTHGAQECLDACRDLCGILIAEAEGRRSVTSDLSRDQVRSTGYVRHTMEAAAWAVATTDSFADAVIAAVNLGDDADTVGAVAGQIAGARYGAASIPQSWRDALLWREEIESLAKRLISLKPT